jgi:hypothetical protein
MLGRSDKTQLCAGDGIASAATDGGGTPGFWMGAQVLGRQIAPLFTVTVLDDDGRELSSRVSRQRWTPAALVTEYRFAHGIHATEARSVHPGGVFVSEWRVEAPEPTPLHVIAWTAVDAVRLNGRTPLWDGALSFRYDAGDGALLCSLAAVGETTSWATYGSDGEERAAAAARPGQFVPTPPSWRQTPFLEHWQRHGLSRVVHSRVPTAGLWYAAVHHAIRGTRDGASAAFAMRVIPEVKGERPPAASTSAAPALGTFEGASRRRWTARFAEVPQLSASDPYVAHAYWYRWFGAFALRIEPGTGAFDAGGASVSASDIGVADAALTPAVVRDLRWHSDPVWGRSALRPFLRHQRADGSLPHIVRSSGTAEAPAPVTVDWGGALRALAELETDNARLSRAWYALSRYGEWLLASRDSDGTGLLELRHPDDTHAVSSPRFEPGEHRLKGVDVTAVAFRLCRALADVAPTVGGDVERWRTRATRIATAVRERLWDDELGFFCDLNVTTGKRARVRSVAGFAALDGIASPDMLARAIESLLDVRRFWLPFPVPSVAADESGFDPFGELDGVRLQRPRNGRTWPADAAMLVDTLVDAEPASDAPLRRAAAQLLRRLIRMHFHDGELHAPSAHEHANPYTGHTSVHRERDECFAAWLVDLIIRHAAGVRPVPGGVRIDPLPMGIESLSITQLRVRGRAVSVTIDGERVTARIDGVEYTTRIGEAIDVV